MGNTGQMPMNPLAERAQQLQQQLQHLQALQAIQMPQQQQQQQMQDLQGGFDSSGPGGQNGAAQRAQVKRAHVTRMCHRANPWNRNSKCLPVLSKVHTGS